MNRLLGPYMAEAFRMVEVRIEIKELFVLLSSQEIFLARRCYSKRY